MDRWQETARTRQSPNPAPEPDGERLRLLIVEPEPLLQWSLGTYLSKWFEVFVVDSAATAQALLDERAVDALVVSDELPDHAADKVETWARLRNCALTAVRTVTDARDATRSPSATFYLEKPFELSTLAQMLGVEPNSNSSGTTS